MPEGRFWKFVPAWADVDEETFLDYRWQSRNAITNFERLLHIIADIAPPQFLDDARERRGRVAA